MRELFQEFGKELRLVIKGDIDQSIEDSNRIVVGLLRQDIKASENRMMMRMDRMGSELRQEMATMKDGIVNGFHDVLDCGVLPQIEGLDKRVSLLERKLKV